MATTDDPPKPKPSRVTLWINVALLLGAVVTFFAWRHARDPHQLWAKRVDENHRRYIDTALRRCFGSTTAADIRRVADGVRAGSLSRPFTDCHRGPMAELLVAPNSFIESIQNPPVEVYRLRERERSALMRITATARLLEQDVSRAAGQPAAEQREPLAAKLEDLAIAIQHEHEAHTDLVAAARDATPFF